MIRVPLFRSTSALAASARLTFIVFQPAATIPIGPGATAAADHRTA